MTDNRAPRLMLVTDRRAAAWPLPDLAVQAIRGGVDLVQFREKDLNDEDLRKLVEDAIAAGCDPARVSVNGNVAIASALGVGIHLPERGPLPSSVRSRVGAKSPIGRSVHSPAAARESAGADYLVAGHVFATSSKPGVPPLGLDGLRRIVEATDLPVLAIGGITAENVRPVLDAGAFGVAVMSAINAAADPAAAARRIRNRLNPESRATMTESETTIDATINGKPTSLAPNTTVSGFLASKSFEERLVVVELNGEILPRSRFAETVLASGDRVEIVHFVGGG
jgi:thiamine biosynthesis protein ThiS